MLTDEQIATMSPTERHDLIKRLARPVDEVLPSRRWLRRTREMRILLLVGSAAVLVPWTAYLAVTLPPRYVANNWDVTWVGSDVMLLVMMVATAIAPAAGSCSCSPHSPPGCCSSATHGST